MAGKMRATVFPEPRRIVLGEKPIPEMGPIDALIRITISAICGTDIQVLKREHPVARGLTTGHQPAGVIEKLGSAIRDYQEGRRVVTGARAPQGWKAAGGRGVDVAIEAFGKQQTFELARRSLGPGGTLRPIGVYSKDLKILLGAFAAAIRP